MRGKNTPTDREEVFKICFALELDLEKSEKLLSRLTEQGIHYRNSREVVYAYCLKYQAGYQEACAMAARLEELGKKQEHSDPMTHLLKIKFQTIKGKEDLFAFLLNEKSRMGEKHNTAYAYFMGMLSILTGEHMEGEDAYSMEYIAENYLRLNMPLNKKTTGYSNAQKIVKKYWPGTRSIKAMKARTEDVNRKTLLLLYIATGGIWEENYQEIDETYVSPDEFLEAHCKRMNHMLEACGMSPMDSRNMFDYLVLYCLRPEHTVFMSERMEELLAELFVVS